MGSEKWQCLDHPNRVRMIEMLVSTATVAEWVRAYQGHLAHV